MTKSRAGESLLFGVLALRMGFITREDLIEALGDWVRDEGQSPGQAFVDRGALGPEERSLIEPILATHLRRHGGDPARSLAALGSIPITGGPHGDVDLQAILGEAISLSTVDGAGPEPGAEAWRAAGPSPGCRFRILRHHARGGLGEVYVAHDEELHREVALKEIQDRHADHFPNRSRFLLEAEVTGRLEHPGIVPVYGMGAYDDGRPYYAMRFIRGDTLGQAIWDFHATEAADRPAGERALAFRELLGRFVAVCNAVEYAHSRGVLHRDLKPSNVMLGPYGETLVVDWGLAKTGSFGDGDDPPGEALRPSAAGEATPTRTGAFLGTPQYMSPEQAAGELDRLGPASDVYSLGATLYCVLAGRSPIESRDVSEVLQRVRRGEFPPPRQVRPAAPRPLEAVCLKAMALRPEDRYPSARALADEIEHWLADEPVSAWREPLPLRLARWGRRHRLLVTGASVASIVAAVSLAVGIARVEQQRREVDRQRRETEKALGIALDSVDGYMAVAEQWLAEQPRTEEDQKELLEQALDVYGAIAAQERTDPEVRYRRARAQRRIGETYFKLDALPEAEKSLRSAAAALQVQADERPSDDGRRAQLASCLSSLGDLLLRTGRREEAERVWRQALSLREARAAAAAPAADRELRRSIRCELAGSHSQIGSLLIDKGNYVEAQQQLVRALEAIGGEDAEADADDLETRRIAARVHNNLGIAKELQKRPADAVASFRRALELRDGLAADRPGSPTFRRDLAASRSRLASVLLTMGRDDEAENLIRDAVVTLQGLVNEFPRITSYAMDLSRTYWSRARFLLNRGDREGAEADLRRALVIREELHARSPQRSDYRRELADLCAALGRLLTDGGRAEEGRAFAQRALDLESGPPR